MIKKKIVAFMFILVSFVLQTTLFQEIALAGVVPNLVLVVTISYAYLRGRTSGIIVGLLCGFMLDMMYGSLIGLYGFIFMTIGFVVGFCQKLYFTDSLLLPTVLIAGGDFVYCLYCYITEFLMRGKTHLGFFFLHNFLPEILYTTVIGIALYRFIALCENIMIRKRKEEI